MTFKIIDNGIVKDLIWKFQSFFLLFNRVNTNWAMWLCCKLISGFIFNSRIFLLQHLLKSNYKRVQKYTGFSLIVFDAKTIRIRILAIASVVISDLSSRYCRLGSNTSSSRQIARVGIQLKDYPRKTSWASVRRRIFDIFYIYIFFYFSDIFFPLYCSLGILYGFWMKKVKT